jgi:hypothetical protein
MTNVVIGGVPKFYMYYCRSSTFKGGDPSSDKQQPFNPITESTGIKMPERIYDLVAPVSDLYPQIEVDKNLEPSTITFRSYFREPFLMLTLFTYKGMPSQWTGTSDTISANFSNRDNVDNNICVQLSLPTPSGSNTIDLLFDGGKITEYRWVGEAQGAVFEEIDIKFAEITENTQAVDIDNGFDDGSFDLASPALDGGWSLWNTNLFADKRVILLTKDVTVTIGGSAPAGLTAQSWKMTIPVPQAMEFVASSFVAGIIYEEVRGPWGLEIAGKLADNQAVSEAIATLATKTKSTAKLLYDAAPLDKYFQFTNAVLKNIDGLSIPEAGKPVDVTYIYEGAGGSVLSYNWTGTESTDPNDMVNHTNIT